jgi:predicted acetyltransferase
MRTIKPIIETGVFEWEHQSRQYPATGKGIQYFKGICKNDKWVDCLLYFGDDNKLQGVLNYYPFGFPPYQKKGSVNLEVRKDKRRQGIATALLKEGMSRFKINLKKQDYTPVGKKFIKNYLQSCKTYY